MSSTARHEDLAGSALSGSSGAVNRTYALAYSGVVAATIVVHKQGVFLHPTDDYTVSSSTLTFLGEVYNDESVDIAYYTLDGVSASTSLPRYATTLELANLLRIRLDLPGGWTPGTSPTRETVGTGDASNTKFYLDQRNILAGTYTLYYGSAITTATTLTETTHFTMDKSTGKITLTAAGVTLLSTNNIYAEYSYVDPLINLSDDDLSIVLIRADARVDGLTQSRFVNTDNTNPDYAQVTQETQQSKGVSDRRYFTVRRPVADIASELATTVDDNDTSVVVTSGDGAGFPATGYIIIEDEVISYSGVSTNTLTGCTRGAFGSTAAAHTSGESIHTTIIEASSEWEGQSPTWRIMSWDDDVFVDEVVGMIQIYKSGILDADYLTSGVVPFPDITNRMRFTYNWGVRGIPDDINRLALIVARQMLVRDNIGKAYVAGRNEFNPELANVDNQEITSIVGNYKYIQVGNT